MSACLVEHFSALEDPRIERNKSHALIDIIVLSVTAIASGADAWEAKEDFEKEKLDWLRKYVPFANGVPSHDCIAYVLSRLSPNKGEPGTGPLCQDNCREGMRVLEKFCALDLNDKPILPLIDGEVERYAVPAAAAGDIRFNCASTRCNLHGKSSTIPACGSNSATRCCRRPSMALSDWHRETRNRA